MKKIDSYYYRGSVILGLSGCGDSTESKSEKQGFEFDRTLSKNHLIRWQYKKSRYSTENKMKGKQDFVHKDRQTACTYDISKKIQKPIFSMFMPDTKKALFYGLWLSNGADTQIYKKFIIPLFKPYFSSDFHCFPKFFIIFYAKNYATVLIFIFVSHIIWTGKMYIMLASEKSSHGGDYFLHNIKKTSELAGFTGYACLVTSSDQAICRWDGKSQLLRSEK